MKRVSYIFHAMDPASVSFLHLTYCLLVVENSHFVTNKELLHSKTVTQHMLVLVLHSSISVTCYLLCLQLMNCKRKDSAKDEGNHGEHGEL